MNTKTIYTAIALASLFISTSVTAHDPSKHATPMKKPNCEAMHKMDSSAMDKNDPVMQAMMKQCGKADVNDTSMHATPMKKPNCKAMHKMDSSTMDMNDPETKAMMQQCKKSNPEGHHEKKIEKPACTQEHADMGHCTMEPDASDAADSEPTANEHKHD